MSVPSIHLTPYLDDEAARRLIEPVGFADPRAAARSVRDLALVAGAAAPLGQVWAGLLAALADAASPDRALVNFARFIQAAPAPPRLLAELAADQRTTEMLVTLFAGSQFLTEILLRDGNHLARLTDRAGLAQMKTAPQFEAEARQALIAAGARRQRSRA